MMTAPDYNDGNWHGWNGGKCPVHPKSVVQVRWDNCVEDTLERAGAWDSSAWRWDRPIRECNRIVSFRVTKPYREPREFWLVGPGGGIFNVLRKPPTVTVWPEVIHVREVTRDE
jgi:hypothetical protein